MNELLRQMDLLSCLAQRHGVSAVDLAAELGVSVPTVKRDVSACRHLGADIVSDRQRGYRLMNWQSIAATVRRWRDLERRREYRLDRGLKPRTRAKLKARAV